MRSATPTRPRRIARIWRRSSRALATLAAAAFVAANLVEVLVKSLVQRPALYLNTRDDGLVQLHGFDSSYPSGHMLRAVLVAATIALTWRRLTKWLVGWCALVAVMIEIAGYHTPTDIAGGIALAVLTLALVRAAAPSIEGSTSAFNR